MCNLRILLKYMVLFSFAFFCTNSLIAQPSPSNPSWPMFHHDCYLSGLSPLEGDLTSYEFSWIYEDWISWNSPSLGDIDGDGLLEIVCAAGELITVINGENGTVLWDRRLTPIIEVISSPALGDINGDGKLEIILVGVEEGSTFITALALNGENGDYIWSYTITKKPSEYWLATSSSPILGDIDEDGKLEVVFGTEHTEHYERDDTLFALNIENGSLLWKYAPPYATPVLGSASFGDVDKDGHTEVVVMASGAVVYCLAGTNGNLEWYRILEESSSICASPALGDINGDGSLEVVVGTWGGLFALEGETGNTIWSYNKLKNYFGTPAIGDIDNDGKLEVVIGSYYDTLYAFNGENGTLLWKFTTINSKNIQSSPVLGDIDGDGKLEVVFTSSQYKSRLYTLNGEDGSLIWSHEGQNGANEFSSPCLGDIDGDGLLEIVNSTYGTLYAYNGLPTGIEESPEESPSLSFNISPNPFIDITNFVLNLPEGTNNADFNIYDVSGTMVKSFPLGNSFSSRITLPWDGRDNSGTKCGSGVYFGVLKVENNKPVMEKVIKLQ